MSFPNRKRAAGEHPSKEERKHALLEAIKLPMLGRSLSQPAVQSVAPIERPAVLRPRAKYAV